MTMVTLSSSYQFIVHCVPELVSVAHTVIKKVIKIRKYFKQL